MEIPVSPLETLTGALMRTNDNPAKRAALTEHALDYRRRAAPVQVDAIDFAAVVLAVGTLILAYCYSIS
jgi:hypothetical protein